MYTVACAYSPSSGVCHSMDNIANPCLQKQNKKSHRSISTKWAAGCLTLGTVQTECHAHHKWAES